MMPFVPNLDKDKIGLGELQQFLTDWKYPKHVISGGIFNAQLQKSMLNLEKKKVLQFLPTYCPNIDDKSNENNKRKLQNMQNKCKKWIIT